MNQPIITRSKEETVRAGRELAGRLSGGSVIALSGDLGGGKTTFTQGILDSFGIEGPYTSPTFVIMKRYDLDDDRQSFVKRIYHVDAYRVGIQEMLALGWEEWLEDPSGIVLLEWPERVADIVPEDAVNVSFEWLDESKRKITITED